MDAFTREAQKLIAKMLTAGWALRLDMEVAGRTWFFSKTVLVPGLGQFVRMGYAANLEMAAEKAIEDERSRAAEHFAEAT